MALILVAGIAIYLGGFFAIDHFKAPAEASIKAISNYRHITDRTGLPIELVDTEFSGRFEMRNHREFALLDRFRVKGPKASATVYGTMVRTNNDFGWLLWQLAVDFEDGSTIIVPKSAEN